MCYMDLTLAIIALIEFDRNSDCQWDSKQSTISPLLAVDLGQQQILLMTNTGAAFSIARPCTSQS